MHALHPEMGIKGIIFAIVLELLFLGICTVLIGYGWAEIKKKKNVAHGFILMAFGSALGALSFWMAKLFIEG